MAKVHKVLMLVENVPVPPDRRVWPEALALRDQGFQVCVICPKSPKWTAVCQESYICVEGIHIFRYRMPAFANAFAGYLLEYGTAMLMTFLLSLKVWYRHGFEVIHAANPPDLFFLIGWFYRPFGKKFVFDQHDLSPELFQVKFKRSFPPLYKALLFFERCSYQSSQVVITTNLSQKRLAVQRGHCSPDKVFIVRNGPNLEQMRLVAPEPELKRGYAYLLAYVGTIEVQDGVEYCLLALHHLVHSRGRRDVSLVLMGTGGQLNALRRLAFDLEVDEYVNFTGWTMKEDVVRYLSVADVGLVPDPQNGMNEYSTMIKTMEYMALEKPIVAFDLLETRSSAGESALYATPNLVEDLANKIEILLDNKELRLRMGALGRKRVAEGLCWDETKKNLLLAYEKLFPRESQVTDSFPVELVQ